MNSNLLGTAAAGKFLVIAAAISLLAGGSLLASTTRPVQDASAFGFEAVMERARAISGQDYVEPSEPALPKSLAELTYDEYRELRFRPDSALFAGDAQLFRVHVFHRGYIFRQSVKVNVIDETGVHEVAYDAALFDYGQSGLNPADLPSNLGFAGFRVHFPVNREGVFDEVIAFLGASYFRVLGAGQVYGLSARGLAIDTAEPPGEEFPVFREFWIEKPVPGARKIRVFGLLDGRSFAGAYVFEIEPGAATRVEVRAYLYPRRSPTKIGVAPLTSMFLHGENLTRYLPDFRPEVHDSDGLLVATADGDFQWRPLDNPANVHRVTRIPADGVKGFGLLQRDRRFDSYEDLESRFEQRPNLWVEPLEGFGAGAIELVEIPTPTEFSDNVVAYFVPATETKAGECIALRYVLVASLFGPPQKSLASVLATRVNPARGEKTALFVISFNGGTLAASLGGGDIRGDVKTDRGVVKNVVVQGDPVHGGVRLAFELESEGAEPASLSARLRRGDEAASEEWIYTYQRP